MMCFIVLSQNVTESQIQQLELK